MLYFLLIMYDPNQPSDPDAPSLMPEHQKLTEELKVQDKYRGGTGIATVSPQTPLVRHGEVRELGELPASVYGGSFVVEVADEAEAIEIAKRVPVGSRGWVEVRRGALFP